MIVSLQNVAEAFQDEYDVDGSHSVSLAKETLVEQEEDIDLETALAALELESDTDLEEPVSRRYRWPTKNHGSFEESSGELCMASIPDCTAIQKRPEVAPLTSR